LTYGMMAMLQTGAKKSLTHCKISTNKVIAHRRHTDIHAGKHQRMKNEHKLREQFLKITFGENYKA
jgi:hypothetical protein